MEPSFLNTTAEVKCGVCNTETRVRPRFQKLSSSLHFLKVGLKNRMIGEDLPDNTGYTLEDDRQIGTWLQMDIALLIG